MNISHNIAPNPATTTTTCCRVCATPLRHTFVDLGMSPLCETFLAHSELDSMEMFYPLHAYVCENCFLVQLAEYVSPEKIFSEYAYFSGYSTSWLAHAKAYCEMIARRLELGQQSLVVELASNDGYLLQHFAPLRVPVLGVEPARNVAQVAINKGIPTITEFFGIKLAEQLASADKSADLIIGNNVLAQVPDINDFVGGIRVLLKPEGVVTLEFPHLQRLIEGNQFDTIYHEHFSYFSLISIENLARRHALRIIDVEELTTHGGSLRVYLAHAASRHRTTRQVDEMLDRESALGFRDLLTYAHFGDRVRATKRSLLKLLVELKNAGKSICGYGAPGKGNTLLNYCAIGTDFLDFTVDRNPYKWGRYTPGTHIPILPTDEIDRQKPDYVLILPWNLQKEIAEQMSHISEWGGKFIIPIPEARIVEPSEN
jgi:SAM-dependent methyltransferase